MLFSFDPQVVVLMRRRRAYMFRACTLQPPSQLRKYEVAVPSSSGSEIPNPPENLIRASSAYSDPQSM